MLKELENKKKKIINIVVYYKYRYRQKCCEILNNLKAGKKLDLYNLYKNVQIKLFLGQIIVDKIKLSTKSINKIMGINVRIWGYTQSYPHYPQNVIKKIMLITSFFVKKTNHVFWYKWRKNILAEIVVDNEIF